MIQRARGFTLIEMMVVISLVTVIITMVGYTVVQTNAFSVAVRNDLQDNSLVARLARQLREDCHRAVAAEIESPNEASSEGIPAPRLRLRLPEETVVEYHLRAGRCERIATKGGLVQHSELFRSSPSLVLSVELKQEAAGQRVLVRAARDRMRYRSSGYQTSPVKETMPAAPWIVIEAAVGNSSTMNSQKQTKRLPPLREAAA